MADQDVPASREQWLQYLDELFLVAQGLTATPEEAARLVDATYRRACQTPRPDEATGEERLWLLRLLRTLHHSGAITAGREKGATLQAESSGFRRKALHRFLRRALPVAFASLSPDQRTLLLLCKVARLSCADAAQILKVPADEACSLLDEAMIALRRSLYAIASVPERRLLDTTLSLALLKSSLRTFVDEQFSEQPGALRPVVEATLRRPDPRPSRPERRAAPEAKAPPRSETPPPSRRQQSQRRASRPTLQDRLKHAFLALVLIALTGLLGYGAATLLENDAPSTSLIALSTERAEAANASLTTNDPGEVVGYLREQLDMRLDPPEFDQAQLYGIDITEVAPDIQVPVLLYEDAAADRFLPVYVYTYEQLNRSGTQLQLEEDILRRIEDASHAEVRQSEAGEVLVWRQRNKILIAVTGSDAAALRERLNLGVSP